ncbi:MAG: ADP-ribosylation factor-like protein [Promethearchaeota archaeon]
MTELKIIFAGLENAGKTSTIYTLDRECEKLAQVSPTVGIEHSMVNLLGLKIYRWDLGGQEKYRKKFINEFERYFLDTSIIFFVISVTEKENHKPAIRYLESICKNLKKHGESPRFGIFLHKVDPDIKELPETGAIVEKLNAKCKRVLEGFSFDIWETSIYAPGTLFRAFSETIMGRFPNGEVIPLKLEEICGEMRSPMAILNDVGGFQFGRYVRPRSQIQEAVQFAEIVNDISQHVSMDNPSELMVIPLGEENEIAVSVFPVRDDMVVFAILLHRGRIAQDPKTQALFESAVKDLSKLLKIW